MREHAEDLTATVYNSVPDSAQGLKKRNAGKTQKSYIQDQTSI